jgi:hypothetical protein
MGPKKTTPAEEYATDEEVVAAIRALSAADLIRLGKYAAFRARTLCGLGVGPDDLLQEATQRTLNGTRRWRKKKVKLVTHLAKTIRSVSDHARDELKGGQVVPATMEDSAGRLDGVALSSHLMDPERAAAASEQLTKIEKKFATDTEVGLLLDGLSNGMSGPEIQQDLQITVNQYETIMTRLRRGLDRERGWRP